MTELKAINYTITLLAYVSCVQPPLPSKIIHYCCHVGGFGEKYLIVLTINMATLSRGGKPRIDHTDKNYTKVGNLRGSQWGSGLSAKLLALLRLSVIFFQLRLTKKFKINLFCFKQLNIN